jgi:protoheme IX farnesyltransferase
MIPVSLTGFTGYFLYNPVVNLNVIFITAGILLLAISASVLNQIQEAHIDLLMTRTHNRPIPAGRISVRNALIFFFLTLSSGSALIIILGNWAAFAAGLFTILWYNGVYTYSKRVTPFAVFPGAITGAIPPVIGWLAAGGGLFDRTIVMVAFLFFVGQMPHFWLIVLRYGGEYEKAGLPCLTQIMKYNQIARLIFVWIALSGIAASFLYVFGIIHTELIAAIMLAITALLVWSSADLIRPGNKISLLTRYNLQLNIYFLAIMILLVTDRILSMHLI